MSFDSQISQCRSDISAFRDLKNKLSAISRNLTIASNSSSDINSKLSVQYSVNDGESRVGLRAKSLSNDINGTNSEIVNKVIPAIDSKINSLQNEIRSLEHQKAEAERREREEREREERERNS